MPVFNRISGGGVIIDATALPSDVASGKIFYNNNGRQVGTNDIVTRYRQKIFSFRKGNTLTATGLGGQAQAQIMSNRWIELDRNSAQSVGMDIYSGNSTYRFALVDEIYAKYLDSVSVIHNGKRYEPYLYQDGEVSPSTVVAWPLEYDYNTYIHITENIILTLNIQDGLFWRREAVTRLRIGVGFSYDRVSYPEQILEDIDVIYTYVV